MTTKNQGVVIPKKRIAALTANTNQTDIPFQLITIEDEGFLLKIDNDYYDVTYTIAGMCRHKIILDQVERDLKAKRIKARSQNKVKKTSYQTLY